MTRVIHHYTVSPQRLDANPPAHGSKYTVPYGTRILCAAMRNGEPVIYVQKTLGRTTVPEVTYTLLCFYVPTGREFDNPDDLAYIGTVSELGLFWHVYGRVVS